MVLLVLLLTVNDSNNSWCGFTKTTGFANTVLIDHDVSRVSSGNNLVIFIQDITLDAKWFICTGIASADATSNKHNFGWGEWY